MPEPPANDPRFVAAIDLIGRSGASEFQIRYDEEQDPIVWVACAKWPQGHEAAGAMTPLRAVIRLLEAVVDGGLCAHCGKPSYVSDDFDAKMPLEGHVCWYVYDPELTTFRRGCEGETTGRAYGRDPRTGETVGRNDPCPCGSAMKWKLCHGA